MFGVGILIVFALLLASFILNVTNSDIKGDVALKLMSLSPDYYNTSKFTDPHAEALSDADR